MRSLRYVLLLALLGTLAGCGGGKPSSLFDAAGYHVRNETVYFLRAFPGEAFAIEQADPATFEVLDSTYAKDKAAVYLDGVPLAQADPASFALLDQPRYSSDAGHVFLGDRVLTEDVTGFAFLDGTALSKDGAHVYWSDGSVLSEDPENFEVLPGDDGYLFTKDSRTVFVNGTTPVEGADPATFEVIDGAYSKDAASTYYFATPVLGADPDTFTTLEAPYARDRTQVYWMGKVVLDADPKTFVVLNADFECTADATRAYYRDQVVEDFDPASIPKGATVTGCSETSLSFS